MHAPRVRPGRGRGRPASSSCVAEQVAERRRSAPGGCVPWSGCSSCCGSPSRTMLRAGRPIASALASEICPASSTNSTSTSWRSSPRAHSHAVPADDVELAGRESRPRRRRSLPAHSTIRLVGHRRHRRPAAPIRTATPASAPPRATSSRKLPITLWLVAVTPTACRPREIDDHPRAGVGLAGARRSLDGERPAVQRPSSTRRAASRSARPGTRERDAPVACQRAADVAGAGRGRRRCGAVASMPCAAPTPPSRTARRAAPCRRSAGSGINARADVASELLDGAFDGRCVTTSPSSHRADDFARLASVSAGRRARSRRRGLYSCGGNR